jgi:SAM-dependent methyltransferase
MLRVVDIGCGSGALVRSLLRQDIDAIGIDPDAGALQAALSGARPAPPGHWIAGSAERLPIADSSVDVAIFLNSLHHIPVKRQVAALAEASRVLCAGGDLIVIEPVAAGSFFELLAPLDDETRVRAAAQAAVHAIAVRQLRPVAAVRFTTTVTFADPDSVMRSFTAADPGRTRLAESAAPEITKRFQLLGTITADGTSCFDQPMTLHHLRNFT